MARWDFSKFIFFLVFPLAFLSSQRIIDPYLAPKWMVLYGSVSFILAANVLIYWRQNLYFPKMNFVYVCILGLLGSMAISMLINDGYYHEQVLDVVVGLSIFLILISKEKIDFSPFRRNLVITLVLSLVWAVKLVVEAIPTWATAPSFPLRISFSFGNPNITAELVGLGIVSCWTYPWSSKWKSVIFRSMCLLGFFYCLLLNSRAVLVGSVVAISVYEFLFSQRLFRRIVVIITGLLLSWMFIDPTSPAFSWQPHFKGSSVEPKVASIKIREARWRNTAEIIRQKPFGIGPGNFEFGYMPYARAVVDDPEIIDGLIIRSPHNGFLELASESGWSALFFLLVMGVLWWKNSWRLANINLAAHGWTCAMAAFLMVDAVFAFPMELPHTFFAGVIIFVAGLSGDSIKCKRWLSDWFRFGLLILVFVFSALVVSAKIIESWYPWNSQLTRIGCHLNPNNWQLCLLAAENSFADGDGNLSGEILIDVLDHRPENFEALKVGANILLASGAPQEACPLMDKLEKTFKKEFVFYRQWNELCKK